MEGCGQVLNELAEIHTLVGYVVENSLVAVTLVLHVANLHLQTQSLGYFAALYHGGVLTCLRFAEFVHVYLTGNAVNALNVVGTLQVSLLQLQLHQSASERHHADVVTWVGLYGHDVTLLQRQVVHVMVISLAGMFELHFHQVGRFCIARDVGQPVVGVQLPVLSADGLHAQPSVTSCNEFVFCLLFHAVIFVSVE